jgi:6-phosphogluconolactonase
MRSPTRMLPGMILLALVASAAMAVPASASQSPVIGHVYVNDNTAGTNTIAAFDRHADGELTEVAGSPFTAAGAGTGAGIGSQGALQVADRDYLLAVDAGSDQISVLRIRADGTLKLIGVVASGGNEPVSIAVHRQLVYVANAGTGGSNYAGFRFRFGQLRPIPGSTVPLPDGSEPGEVLFNRDGTNLAGMRVGTSLIDSFSVRPDGRLVAAPGSPFTAQGPGPFGSEFRPTDPHELYLSNAHGGASTGTVSGFRVSLAGALSSIGGSPFPDLQTAPCWVEISHDGHFLFAVNTASGSISRYAIEPDGALTLLGSTTLRDSAGTPEDARLSPDGKSLWVVEAGGVAVAGLTVRGADLLELPSSPTPLPGSSAPFGIVVT